MTDNNFPEIPANMLDITQRGIDSMLKEAEKAAAIKKTDRSAIEIANYKINTITAYTIAEQVLVAIRNRNYDPETAQLVYGHLKGKLGEIKEGFSGKYNSITNKSEDYLVGPKSSIAQEFKMRGILK